ncbi:hypothetical protein IL306_004902 [Fusarium sp. DS 682]|nr:hypothetical protein IL306_004902 [Fusarium sp. DS 682]
MLPTKRKAGNAVDSSERKRAQNHISQQCLREKNLTYIRNLEETIDVLQKVATGSDPHGRYSVLLDAHLKLIQENQRLEEALLRLRKKLLSIGQSATAAADDEVFASIFRRRDAENPGSAQVQHPDPSTELANGGTSSALNPSVTGPCLENIPEQGTSQGDMFKDASFLLDLSMAGQGHETLTPGTMRPEDSFLDPAISSTISPRSLLFVPVQLSITSMSVVGSRFLSACRRHLAKLHDAGNEAEMVDKMVKTAVRFSMRCVGLESYVYGVIGPEYGEWYSSEYDIVEEAIFQELDRQMSTAVSSPDNSSDGTAEANDVAKFLGLDDFCVWKLSKEFAQKYPKLDCSTAYVVFRFLNIHEKLCKLYPSKNYVDHAPVRRPKMARGAQVGVLSLGGLTCASYVFHVQEIIETVPGVLKATVSLGLLRAQVEFNGNLISEGDIVDAIRSAGYDAESIPASDSQSWASLIIQEPTNSQKNHVASYQRDFVVAAVASVVFHLSRSVNNSWYTHNNYLSSIPYLAVAMSLLAGSQLHLEALRSAWHGRRPNMATIASLGILLALVQAGAISLQADIVKPEKVYLQALEAIPVLSTSVLGGRLLKAILSQRNRAFASPVSSLVPEKATVGNKSDEHTSVPIDMLSVDDRVVIKQGEYIPCDGVVESTESALIMETWINGSLEPRAIGRGDTVYAGCQVHQGNVVYRATACGRFTRLDELLTSVVTAEMANTEPQVHLATSWFSMRASKFGVRLVTSYGRMRNAASAQTILFDKTGTLTHGDLKVSHVNLSRDWDSHQWRAILWKAVQEVEAGITHPTARALVQESVALLPGISEHVQDTLVSDVKHELGRGAQGIVTLGSESTSWKLAIGSRKYIESLGVSVNLSQIPVKLRDGIATTVVLAINGEQTGVIVLEDRVRSDAHTVIRKLKDLGLAVGMITGDNVTSATSVAHQVGIDSGMVFANALPEEKSRILAQFLHHGTAIYSGYLV